MNIPLILTASILPDIDFFLKPLLEHGGPTHSLIMLTIIFLPAFLIWKIESLPYFIATVSHPLIGDYLTRTGKESGVQLFFPITSSWFSAGSKAAIQTYIYAELALFAIFLALMAITKDAITLFKPHKSNMLLTIPITTALLPVFTRFPIAVPQQLIIPHIILIILLTLPILLDLWHLARHRRFN